MPAALPDKHAARDRMRARESARQTAAFALSAFLMPRKHIHQALRRFSPETHLE